MKQTWVKLGVLLIAWMAFLFSFVDRLSWPPILPLAMKELSMTAAQAGSFMTAFYVGYVITQLPGGLLTDRFGYRKVLMGSFFVMGIFTAMMGTIHSYEQGILYRVLAGAGSGAVFSACVRAIFTWFEGPGRGTAMGFFMTSSSLGVSVVNLFVPGVAATHGWETSFYVAGVLPIIGLVLSVFLLKEKPKEQKRDVIQVAAGQFWRDVAGLLRNRNLMLAGVAGFCAMWATWGTATWANTYLNKSLGLPLGTAGYFMSLFGVVAIICKPLVGIASDLLGGRRKMLLFWCMFLFGPALLWFGANRSVSVLYVLVPVLGIAAFLYSPILNTMIGELVEQKLVGTATGLVNTIWQLGSLISPLAVGAVIDATNNYMYAFATLAVGPIAGALLLLLVREPRLKRA